VHPGLMRTELQRNMGVIGPVGMVCPKVLTETFVADNVCRNYSSRLLSTVPTPSFMLRSLHSSTQRIMADMLWLGEGLQSYPKISPTDLKIKQRVEVVLRKRL
jgi:hypothetical protein